jgi:hypothetical protein
VPGIEFVFAQPADELPHPGLILGGVAHKGAHVSSVTIFCGRFQGTFDASGA